MTRPDDWHLHLRDGAAMQAVLPHSARQFARAIVMPNLKPPVCTTAQASSYRERILAALPDGVSFQPLMTLYLTDSTAPDEIDRAVDSGVVKAVKLYPAGATTNSDSGVTDIDRVLPTLQRMAQRGLPLLVHGEVTDRGTDIFDREHAFLDRVLGPLLDAVPGLKVVLEHITTAAAVDFVRQRDQRVAATITAHHLLVNRNALFEGGLRPHNYCLPVLKRERDRVALLQAATSGEPRFFLGTDSAPHPVDAKESACGCAGCFTAHAAVELYAEAFDGVGALHALEGFASHHGPDWYGLPRNTDTITLHRVSWQPAASLPFSPGPVTPWRSDRPLQWRVRG